MDIRGGVRALNQPGALKRAKVWLTMLESYEVAFKGGRIHCHGTTCTNVWDKPATCKECGNPALFHRRAFIRDFELELKDTQAAREMALVSLRNSRARIAELEAQQVIATPTEDVDALQAQIRQLTSELNAKAEEAQTLELALEQAKAATVPVQVAADQSELQAKLQ